MIFYTAAQIADIIKAREINLQDYSIKYIAIDSRKIISPADTVFFALQGERHNGHTFIRELYQKGTRVFVISEENVQTEKYPEAVFLLVNDSLIALHQFASYHRLQYNYAVVGITGSNGKTIVKEWLTQLLQYEHKIIRSPKSYNSQVGVPLSVSLMKGIYDIGIFEAGISRKNEMDKLEPIIKPDIGIFTTIGEAHQENFNSLEEKVKEKIKLFKDSKAVLYCKDHTLIDDCLQQAYPEKMLISWSVKDRESFLNIQKIEKGEYTTRIFAKYDKQNIETEIPFKDEASIENAIHLLTFLLYWKYDEAHIKERMKRLFPVAMRLESKEGVNNCTLINDSYNSDFNSLSIALDFLNQQHKAGNKTVILSDILQSGRDEKDLYKAVAGLMKEKKINKFIGIGPKIKQYADFFDDQATFFETTGEFLQKTDRESFMNEMILIKGARDFQFERISQHLEYKAHRTVLEINLDALVHNLNYFRSHLYPSTKMMVMVKAFSYGSGLFQVANLLQYHRVDYLGVAFSDEGVLLRDSGINMPIMVMQPEERGFEALVNHKLEPEVFSFPMLKSLSRFLKAENIKNFPVHIKIDTGMHRLGFGMDEIEELINWLQQSEEIHVKSVLSHMAASDEAIHDGFSHQQIARFEQVRTRFRESFDHHILYHLLNSAGIERFPEAQFDMVRLGIGLYGVSAVDHSLLRNISTMKSRIIQLKKIKAGETIGYGRKGKAPHDKEIAVIPIGYADGLSRKLSNGEGQFYIHGQKAPVIGNVCMDVTMADVTGMNTKIGDETILFGEIYPVYKLAQQLGTIPYEILTGISQRVKRIYYQE